MERPGPVPIGELRGESGVAMAMTLAMIFLILILSGTLVALAMNEYQTAGVGERSLQADQLAQAAVEKGIFELKRDPNWADAEAATKNTADNTTWKPLWDGAIDVSNVFFPAPPPASSPLGTISVEVCRYNTDPCQESNPKYGAPGCDASRCIWLRGTGKVGNATRRYEVLLIKLGIADFSAYSATGTNLGAGGGGLGTFTIHGGSFYVGSCVPGQSGPNCVALYLQGNSAILNDRPGIGDTAPCDLVRCNNRVFVHGRISGQGNSWQIGLDSQPMWSVHAYGWDPAFDNQIDALRRDNDPPFIPFPSAATFITENTISRANQPTAYVCTEKKPKDCDKANSWRELGLDNPDNVLTLASDSRVLIPDTNGGINCTQGNETQCNSIAAEPSPSVNGPNNWTLVFDGHASPAAKLVTQDGGYLYTKTRVLITKDTAYNGLTTWLIDNTGTGTSTPSLRIEALVTPACKASQVTGCAQTFGQPGGDAYAFAARGDAYSRGAGTELNLVLLAQGTLKNDNPQNWYGVFVANLLDFNNNPNLYFMNSLASNLPPGVQMLFASTGGGVRVARVREVF